MPRHPLLIPCCHPPAIFLAVKPDGHARWRWRRHRSVPAVRGSLWVRMGLPTAFVARNRYRGGWGGEGALDGSGGEGRGAAEAAMRAERAPESPRLVDGTTIIRWGQVSVDRHAARVSSCVCG
ncbi:hypothetical protein K439DRAFT_1622697 [Ramaria rubella]|nr:hypothetical protein K439DRAFT_1622697 [Ramaria rubella]